MLISQLLRTKRPGVVVISPDASIRSAIAQMVRQHVGSLVVVDEDQRLMGVVSEREIIQHLDLEDPDLTATAVRNVMRTDVPVASSGRYGPFGNGSNDSRTRQACASDRVRLPDRYREHR